jgi:hypothetical protein
MVTIVAPSLQTVTGWIYSSDCCPNEVPAVRIKRSRARPAAHIISPRMVVVGGLDAAGR